MMRRPTAEYARRIAPAVVVLVLLGVNTACQVRPTPPEIARVTQAAVPSTGTQSTVPAATSPIQATPTLSPAAPVQPILVDYPNTTAVIPPQGTVSFRHPIGSLGSPPTPAGGGALRVESVADQPATLTYDFAGHLTLVTAPDQAIVILEGPTGVFMQRCVVLTHQLNSVQCAADLSDTLKFTTVPIDHVAPATGLTQYAPGWNLIASADSTPLLGDLPSVYLVDRVTANRTTSGLPIATGTTLPRLTIYWTYFFELKSITLIDAPAETFSYSINRDEMTPIGNATNRQAQVTGVGILLVYDPTTATYQQTTLLEPGQAGWVYSSQDGTVTISTATR